MPERASYEPGTPSWVDLTTPDLAAALRFYGDLFGWEFEDAGEEAGHYHQALKDGKRVAGLGPNQPGSPPMAFWTTYFSGTDVDAHATAITENGGKVMFGPLEVFEQGRMLVGQDPTGAMFGIWEPGEHVGAQLVNEDGTLSWNELIGNDLDAATAFYRAVFGHEIQDLPDPPPGVAYKIIAIGGRAVGGISGMGGEGPPAWTAYFMLDDVDAGFERVRELGGEVLAEPFDSPYGRYAPARDPQGAVFSLIQGPGADG
jgi:predicted enzyme related to lactoylglutathione lyase